MTPTMAIIGNKADSIPASSFALRLKDIIVLIRFMTHVSRVHGPFGFSGRQAAFDPGGPLSGIRGVRMPIRRAVFQDGSVCRPPGELRSIPRVTARLARRASN